MNEKSPKNPTADTDVQMNQLTDEALEHVSGGKDAHVGSQSTGAGAGKVTFNPFSITRKIDVSSP
jgi:bacteriocin-like protein